MALEAEYAPGSATLIGSGMRWLLVDSDLADELVEDLWRLLHRPGPVVQDLVARVEKAFPGHLPSLVVLDAGPTGASATRGGGRLQTDGATRTLTFGTDSPARRRLLGGVVSAGALRLTEAPVPTPARSRRAGTPAPTNAPLISGIPEHILGARTEHAGGGRSRPAAGGAGRLPAGPPPPVPLDPLAAEAPEITVEPMHTMDHDGQTIRATGAAAVETSPALDEHTAFRTDAPETVLAVHCPEGHLTAAFTDTCRVCRQPVPMAEPQRIPRPQLGVLRLPSGEVVPVDRGIVLGRRPAAVPGSERWPHLVHLPAESTYLSRMHLQIELDGWLVLARDLGSQGGSRLHLPGREPELIRPFEPYVLEHGWVLDLADVYAVTFEVTG